MNPIPYSCTWWQSGTLQSKVFLLQEGESIDRYLDERLSPETPRVTVSLQDLVKARQRYLTDQAPDQFSTWEEVRQYCTCEATVNRARARWNRGERGKSILEPPRKKRAGRPAGEEYAHEARWAAWSAARAAGVSVAKIAAEAGVSRQAVYHALRRERERAGEIQYRALRAQNPDLPPWQDLDPKTQETIKKGIEK